MQEIVQSIFDVSSFGSVVFRGLIWLTVSVVIIASMDSPNPQKAAKNLKANVGSFLFFLVLSTTLVYFLFGYQPG